MHSAKFSNRKLQMIIHSSSFLILGNERSCTAAFLTVGIQWANFHCWFLHAPDGTTKWPLSIRMPPMEKPSDISRYACADGTTKWHLSIRMRWWNNQVASLDTHALMEQPSGISRYACADGTTEWHLSIRMHWWISRGASFVTHVATHIRSHLTQQMNPEGAN